MIRIAHIASLIVAAIVTLLSALAYYDRYYRWRACFNEAGRCFDRETGTVQLEQAGMVWMLFAGLGAVAVALLARPLLRKGARKTR